MRRSDDLRFSTDDPMQAIQPNVITGTAPLPRTIVVGAGLMVLALAVAVFFAVEESGGLNGYPFFFLLPWILVLALVFIAPTAVLIYRRQFTLTHPIIYLTWTHLFPAYVLGGIFLASGLSHPYFVDFIQEPERDLPYTLVLVGMGFIGLCVGFWLPLGRRIGSFVERLLPSAEYKTSAYFFPAWLLFILGALNTLMAFTLGLFGFQKAQEINSYDGLVFLSTLFWAQGIFLLWSVIFRESKLTPMLLATAVILIITMLFNAVFSGSRGSLLFWFMMIVLAYVFSGRTMTLRKYLATGLLLLVPLAVGVIYGSTFRSVKGSEERQDIGGYTENMLRTFDEIGKGDPGEMLQFGMANLTERVDMVSTVAVVVSNYETLQPYEEAYGLNDNIWKDTTTFLVPRIIWGDKPAASDARRYSDLYFNFGESSTAITPFGDLLRNYGPIGVPAGMFLLGILFRIIYRALVESQLPRLWRICLYFMLLMMSVSLEGFYGTIIPYMVKNGVTAVMGIAIVCFLAAKISKGSIRMMKSAGTLVAR